MRCGVSDPSIQTTEKNITMKNLLITSALIEAGTGLVLVAVSSFLAVFLLGHRSIWPPLWRSPIWPEQCC
jgi:hypothetical protein